MKKVFAVCLAFAPVLAIAQGFTNVSTGFRFMATLFNNITVFIFGLSVVWFFWGVFKYVIATAGDEEAHKKARSMIIQGVVGLAVMVSVYGLINFVTNSVGLNNSTTPQPPLIQTPSNNYDSEIILN